MEKKQIASMMELNPIIDYLLAETIVLTPEDRRQEILQQITDNPREPEPAKELTEDEQHACYVLSAEQQAEAEEAQAKVDAERLALYEKLEKEKEVLN